MTISHRQVRFGRPGRSSGSIFGAPLLFLIFLGIPGMLAGQAVVQTASESTISVRKGQMAYIRWPDNLTLIDIGDIEVADYRWSEVRPNELMVYGTGVGATTLILKGQSGPARLYTVEVTADVASIQTQIDELFPGAGLSISSTGNSIILSGEVRDPSIVRKAVELAETQGIHVVNNIDAPAPEQILLHVEFAEVSRSMLREVGGDLLRILNPADLGDAFDEGDIQLETLSEGFVNLLIAGDEARLDAVIRALKTTGDYQSLAEPNLVTREGEEASFLAGGEFPFPSIQGGQAGLGAVTIQWREFGIRLNFTPQVTNSGNIQLKVAPEVSSLDFANGLTFQGYEIPALLSRKVNTDVELRPGQTLAIGGLLDNTLLTDVEKIPLLGDIPILGFFFRQEKERQSRTELLVLVTPHILDSDNLPVQALPGGDPNEWNWDSHIRKWIEERAVGAGSGGNRSGGG